jgi:hypothetical protein
MSFNYLKKGDENTCFTGGLVAFPESPFLYIKRHGKRIPIL